MAANLNDQRRCAKVIAFLRTDAGFGGSVRLFDFAAEDYEADFILMPEKSSFFA